MFKFKDVISSSDGLELSCFCYLDPDLTFFKGHFDDQQMMPAAAQILMVSALLKTNCQQDSSLEKVVYGGEKIKFSQAIEPGEMIAIHVLKKHKTVVQFAIHKQDGSLATSGRLLLNKLNKPLETDRKICGLIPVYNNPMTIERVVKLFTTYIDTVIIIDDGSNDDTALKVKKLATDNPNIHVHRHDRNQGKGAAVQTGLKLANELGYDDVLQVDADGQHNLNDIPEFLQTRQKYPGVMIMGAPVFDKSIPAIRKYGRKLTHLMIALEAGTTDLPDAMCGFRLYPVKPVMNLGLMSSRMSFDPEVMIRAHWAGVTIKTIPTKVRYLSAEEGGVSHFKMIHDNVLHVCTHTRLLLQAPFRWIASWLRN